MAFGGRALHMDIVRSHEGWLPGALSSTRYYWESDICPNDRWNACGCKETPPEEYKVGIMGFLLSCKQAYTEGIDILYSTNIITIQTTVLLFYLPISSYPADSPVSHNLEPILNNIVSSCRQLRSLCISLKGCTSEPKKK
ncbi:hypothetical protein COCVIDRAFT_40618 [Bipolaris victoriae FI3]|uniref:DUF7730 domain-containing protein n=1 Tax=Bipolaris victoriae (strain FI3) TaxID=930091 RepID=W7E6Q7_BIPV3|nr:hypothetical protein COCVIDRAFT_40618 [Bipolaris victoriae FI3]